MKQLCRTRDGLRDSYRQRSGQLRRAAATWSGVAADYLNTWRALNSQEFSHSLGSLKLGFLVLAVVIKQ